MRGAAPLLGRRAVFLISIALGLACASGGSSAPARSGALPAQLWAVELDAGTARAFTAAEGARLRLRGVNAIVLDAHVAAPLRALVRK
jgi:hypothetical protein